VAHILTLRFASRFTRHRHLVWLDGARPVKELPHIADPDPDRVLRLPTGAFDARLVPLKLGRFYPAQLLHLGRPVPADLFRVAQLEAQQLVADFNHPLSGHPVVFALDSAEARVRPLGKVEDLARWAGMEAPLMEAETDFADAGALSREDPGDDAAFYASPRRVVHLDATCLGRITALYERLLGPGEPVMDLMAGWRSHLPQDVAHPHGEVVGLGMNDQEMADNPQLGAFQVHDLNRDPRLPFPEGYFSAVVNTASIEYLTNPLAVLRDAHRVLRPGGVFVATFSTRFFPPKAVTLWTRLHPMERLGWVLELMHRAGFQHLHSFVEQGLARDPADRYADRLDLMDPLFAAWGVAG
jgi:hypothetical protein